MKIIPSMTHWWDASEAIKDIWGRAHILNKARPVTIWRRLRAKLGWAEADTMMARIGDS